MLSSLRRFVPILVSAALTFYVVARMDIADVATEIFSVSWPWLLGIMVLLAGNILSVSLRLGCLLRDFGAPQSFKTAFRANVSGLASSLFLISILGAVLGRQMVLQREGVRPALITVLTGYERVVLLAIGGGLALLGGLLLYGFSFLRDLNQTMPLGQIGLAIGLAISLSLFLARQGQATRLLAGAISWRNLRKFLAVSGITLCAQAFAISTYVLALLALGTDASPLQLLAGALIVSFAASLPISVNGWGVRELAAIAVFGQFGASPHEAVAASVMVGLCSTAAVLAATPYALVDSFRGKKSSSPAEVAIPTGQGDADALARSNRSDREMNQILAILCGLGAGILLFFQMRLEISGNAVTANLADPIALSALAAMAAYFLFQHKLPIALPKPVWLWLGGITLVLVFGFLNGVLQFGITPWALSNRLFGWLVILGYVACGALIVSQFGAHGRRILLLTILATAVVVVIVRLGVFAIHFSGVTRFSGMSNFEGYSANRNTFAVMLLMALAGLFCLLPLFRIGYRRHMALIAGGILFLGLWQTGSKLGLACTAILLLTMLVVRPVLWRNMVLSVALAVGFYLFLSFLPHILALLANLIQSSTDELSITDGLARSLDTFVSTAIDERAVSIHAGINLWLENPLIGSGLGAAIRLNLGSKGLPLVIHSTPIWILAEFGIIGFATVLSLPCWLLWQTRAKLWRAIRHRRLSSYHLGLLGTCLVFGLFGLGHEIAYQRLFWLLIGAYAAQTITRRSADTLQTTPPA